jgi:DNA ligase-1
MNNFIPIKPYKLTESDLYDLHYPLIAQPKLDGFRCVVLDGSARSYNLKHIRNFHTRDILNSVFNWDGKALYKAVDGELVIKDDNNFQTVQSAFGAQNGTPAFNYIVFDILAYHRENHNPYKDRFELLKGMVELNNYGFIKLIEHTICHNRNEVLGVEAAYLDLGYEGIILRSPGGPYKWGRSTLKEEYLLALKRTTDAEAVVVDVVPLEFNLNEPELDHHGHTKRSSVSANKVESNMLGAFTCKGINGRFKDVVFNVGTGFTQKQRIEYYQSWKLKGQIDDYSETIITYKYQDVGSSEKPRHPVFMGIRRDL